MDIRYFKKCEDDEAERMRLIAKRKRRKDIQDTDSDLGLVEGNTLFYECMYGC